MKVAISLSLLLLCITLFAQKQEAYKDTSVTNFFKRTTGVIAMDGGYTITLNNGKVLWLFGDSYVNDYDTATRMVPCLFEARNSALLQPSANNFNKEETIALTGKGDQTFLKDANDPNHFFWPGCGYQNGDTIFVYGMNMKNATGGLGFAKAGNDVWIKLLYPSLKTVGISELPATDSIQFGSGMFQEGKYVYVYGGKQTFISANIYVARFNIDKPLQWSYWDGSAFNSAINLIKPIAVAPSNSATIAKVKHKYLMLTSEFSIACDGGKSIYAAVSNSPEGPFSTPKIIYTINDTLQGHYPFFYLPIAHPDCISNNNELLIHYSINGYEPCIKNCIDNKFNPEYYRPQAVRVPLELLGID